MKSAKQHALLVLNGEPPSAPLLRSLVQDVDLIIAADGGANILKRHKISPDVIIGDLDSLSPQTKRHFKNAQILKTPDPNSTDFEKAFDFLIRRKVATVALAGMTGKRIDFTLGNFISLWQYAHKIEISIYGEDWFATPIQKRLDLELPVGTTVSLVPFSSCKGITLRGFQYPLTKAQMKFTSLGVSNQTIRKNCSVQLSNGKLLAVVLTK